MAEVAIVGALAGGSTSTAPANALLAPRLTVGGISVVLVGDLVASHDEHDGPTMAEGTPKITISGVQVCIQNNAATCGHTISTGTTPRITVGA